jgi:hypothetical protein
MEGFNLTLRNSTEYAVSKRCNYFCIFEKIVSTTWVMIMNL